MKNSLPTSPISRGMYAWNYIHAGSFLLFIGTSKGYYKFLMLPGPTEYFLTFEDFAKGIERNILEFVEVLPEEIYQETLSLSCPFGTTTLDV